jgi:hypothetical protein
MNYINSEIKEINNESKDINNELKDINNESKENNIIKMQKYAILFDYCIYGKLEKVKKMVNEGLEIDEDTFGYTCYFGQFNVAKWIYQIDPDKYYKIISDKKWTDAVKLSGHPHIYSWMLSLQ